VPTPIMIVITGVTIETKSDDKLHIMDKFIFRRSN
jgi:hypothetical protein